MRRAGALLLAGLVGAVLSLSACGGGDGGSADASSGAAAGSTPILTDQALTALDQQFAYPRKKPAQVSSAITELQPGQESGWRRNNVPVLVYVLEGTLTVEYDAGVTKEFAAGTGHVEAVDVFHNAMNKGDATVRVLEVVMGAKGVRPSVPRAG